MDGKGGRRPSVPNEGVASRGGRPGSFWGGFFFKKVFGREGDRIDGEGNT